MNSCKDLEKEECKNPECIWVDKKLKYCRSSKNKKKSTSKTLSTGKERVWLQQDTCYYSLMENKKNAPYILFDYDDTLCEKFTSNLLDNVKHTLIQLEKTHNICIFTNQMGISKGKNTHQHLRELLKEFTTGVDNTPIDIFYAINDDNYRKPMTGMYQLFTSLLKPQKVLYYCGDAGGRKNDFSIGDLYFSNNCNLVFTTPEKIFNDSKASIHFAEKQLKSLELYKEDIWFNGTLKNPRPIISVNHLNEIKSRLNLDIIDTKKMLVIMVGGQAIGKSTLSHYLSNKYKFGIIDADTQKTMSKMKKIFNNYSKDCEYNGIIIDNTNPSIKTRKEWIDMVDNKLWKTMIIFFDISKEICIHLTKYRTFFGGSKIPTVAIHKYYKNLEIPTKNEVDDFYILNNAIYNSEIEFNDNLRFN